jgi:hypothetical protein
MKSSFAWRYANAHEGKFQFRLRQDKDTNTWRAEMATPLPNDAVEPP